MAKKNGLARNLLIWSYERGTLQYDIICAMILAFIFFVPPSCFAPKKKSATAQTTAGQAQVTSGKQLPPENSAPKSR